MTPMEKYLVGELKKIIPIVKLLREEVTAILRIPGIMISFKGKNYTADLYTQTGEAYGSLGAPDESPELDDLKE